MISQIEFIVVYDIDDIIFVQSILIKPKLIG